MEPSADWLREANDERLYLMLPQMRSLATFQRSASFSQPTSSLLLFLGLLRHLLVLHSGTTASAPAPDIAVALQRVRRIAHLGVELQRSESMLESSITQISQI
ncbi:hypothetical protein EYF80_002774 [Liparis tanakae]|uniref:Uncharacterized protein n=1 Tax=Liparis tanakae TaxID=230148 RepID=A0A4Z2J9X5_9TELE|nr:hypothetical protein EYF80_002774 [Liparis tanakae]